MDQSENIDLELRVKVDKYKESDNLTVIGMMMIKEVCDTDNAIIPEGKWSEYGING